MSDDDDWIGTPPEGHHTADRARPEFWRGQWQPVVATGGVILVLIVVVLVLALVVH